jgi:hypothetical protein
MKVKCGSSDGFASPAYVPPSEQRSAGSISLPRLHFGPSGLQRARDLANRQSAICHSKLAKLGLDAHRPPFL